MRDFSKCPLCHSFHWSNEKCRSAFTIFHEDYLGEDGKVIHADNAEDAALIYAAYYNSNSDYRLMTDTIEIEVQDADGVRVKYEISATPSIDYSAKIKNE